MKILLSVEGNERELQIEKFDMKQGDEFRIEEKQYFVRRMYWRVHKNKIIPVVILDHRKI